MQKRNLRTGTWLITSIIIILSFGYKSFSQSESILICEFLALNKTVLTDEDGDYSDWIEIYNPTSEDIDLLTGKSSELVTIYQNYPNPFSDITNINYQLYEEAHIQLSIFNIVGRHIVTLEDLSKPAGNYNISWRGFNQNNNVMENGMYFYRIVAKSKNGTRSILTKKMLYIR